MSTSRQFNTPISLSSAALTATHNSNTIGNLFTTGGNVGIGTKVPGYRLQVDGDVALNVLPGIGSVGSIKIGRQDFNARWHMINVNTGTAASLSNMIFNLHDAVTSTSIAPILTLRGDGSVGIGTTAPVANLDINGDIWIANGLRLTQNSNINYIQSGLAYSTNSVADLRFGPVISTSAWMTIRTSGNVGIGTTSPTTALYVSGSGTSITSGITFVKSSGAYSGTTYENGVGARWYSGSENNTSTPTYIIYNNNNAGAYIAWGGTSWTSNSDRSLKTDFEDILNPLDKISQIKGTYYKFKTDSEDTLRRLGVIAQDVQAVLPEIVTQNAEGKLGVNYTELIPLLIESIKELNSENELLKQDITNIKTQLGL